MNFFAYYDRLLGTDARCSSGLLKPFHRLKDSDQKVYGKALSDNVDRGSLKEGSQVVWLRRRSLSLLIGGGTSSQHLRTGASYSRTRCRTYYCAEIRLHKKCPFSLLNPIFVQR